MINNSTSQAWAIWAVVFITLCMTGMLGVAIIRLGEKIKNKFALYIGLAVLFISAVGFIGMMV